MECQRTTGEFFASLVGLPMNISTANGKMEGGDVRIVKSQNSETEDLLVFWQCALLNVSVCLRLYSSVPYSMSVYI